MAITAPTTPQSRNCTACQFIWDKVAVATTECPLCGGTTTLRPLTSKINLHGIEHRSICCIGLNCTMVQDVACFTSSLFAIALKLGYEDYRSKSRIDRCLSCFEPDVAITKMEADYIAVDCKHKHSFKHPLLIAEIKRRIKK